jgi:O-antigen/teichoic acid export membrane protein
MAAGGLRLLRQVATGKTGLGAIFQTLSTNILMQGLNIATGVVTARILAPQGRGELAAMIMWPQFLAAALTFGMQISLIFQMRTGPERHGEFVGTALLIALLSGALAAIVGFFGIPYWLHGYPPDVIQFARWAMLAAPLTSLGSLLYTSAQAVQEFGRFNKFRALPQVLILTSLLALNAFHALTPRTAALAYLLSNIPVVFWNGLWAIRRFQLKFDNVFACGKLLLGYGLRAWGMDLIGAISDQVDRILIVAFLSPRDMGLYVISQSSARLFTIIPGALQLVMSPKIVLLGPKLGAPLLVRTARITFVIMCAGAIPLAIVAPYALTVVYGQKFMASAPVLRVLLAEAVIGGFTWLLAQGFSALGKPGRATLQQILGLSASIPLLLVLVPRFGIDGACYALLASTMIRCAFAILSYRLLFGESLAHFLPRLSDIHWLLEQVRPSHAKGRAAELSEGNV